MNMNRSALFATSTLFMLIGPQTATAGHTQTLDFEDFNTGNLGTTALFNLPDLNIRFDVDSPILSIVNPFPAVQGWGHRSLLLNHNINQTPLTISFLDDASAFAIEYGDFGGTESDTIRFSIYSGILGSGDLLDRIDLITTNDIGILGPDLFEFATTDGSLGIGSVIIETAGVGGTPSLFFDNLSVTTPTPGTIAAFLTGAFFVSRRRRVIEQI